MYGRRLLVNHCMRCIFVVAVVGKKKLLKSQQGVEVSGEKEKVSCGEEEEEEGVAVFFWAIHKGWRF
ncbi:MAG: hypothetical protein FWC18_05240 [Cystobacterineae bacterium]|nr:hypothetical protein [Cystobacterineae bacterium]